MNMQTMARDRGAGRSPPDIAESIQHLLSRFNTLEFNESTYSQSVFSRSLTEYPPDVLHIAMRLHAST